MKMTCGRGVALFRLWISTCVGWSPTCWNDVPSQATAVEPVEDCLYTADEAALVLEGFNSAMLEQGKPFWVVAVPVTVRYEGDTQAGLKVRGHAFADNQ